MEKTICYCTSARCYSDEIMNRWTLYGHKEVGDTFISDGIVWEVVEIIDRAE